MFIICFSSILSCIICFIIYSFCLFSTVCHSLCSNTCFPSLSCTTGFCFIFIFLFLLLFFIIIIIIIFFLIIFYVNRSLHHNIVVNDISVCILIELHVCKYTCLL